MKERVVITGLGCVFTLGNSVDQFCMNLSSLIYRKSYDLCENSDNHMIFNKIKDFKFYDSEMLQQQYKLDISCQYVLEATRQALEDAGIINYIDDYSLRIGIVIGSTFGLLNLQSKFLVALYNTGKASPILFQQSANNLLSGIIAYKYKIRGFNTTLYNGWTSSLDAIWFGQSLIKNNHADIVIVGGVHTIPKIIEDNYLNLITKNAKKPKGFFLSEGTGIVILESEHSAIMRNVQIKGILIGGNQESFYGEKDFKKGIIQTLKANKNIDYYFANMNGLYFDQFEKEVIDSLNLSKRSFATKFYTGECGAASGIMQLIFALYLKNNMNLILNVCYRRLSR